MGVVCRARTHKRGEDSDWRSGMADKAKDTREPSSAKTDDVEGHGFGHGQKPRGPEGIGSPGRMPKIGGDDDVEGHGFGHGQKPRGPEGIGSPGRMPKIGGDDDVEGHGFSRGGSNRGE